VRLEFGAMTTTVDRKSAAPAGPTDKVPAPYDRWLGHPAAFLATTLVLFALFGWTFVTNPDRVAPTKDPAYYTWRTEVLISEEPETLLDIEGAFGMFAGGYRVTAPVIGAFLRHIPGASALNVTVLLMVGLPVLTAVLLATFAYRNWRDPLIWHAVAFGSGSLFLTPPFVGYLDNLLCLFWLASALPFMRATRTSPRARLAFATFVLLSGMTHPTTTAIFCLTLGAIAAVRLLTRRFDFRSVIRDDGWMLASAFAAAVLTVVIWSVGIWGRSASLSEAALPPPYGSDFFIDRMTLWIDAMRPALNGPLFVIGAVGLLAAGRKAAEDDLALIAIVWLAPLAGLFGFLAGLTYPYYRFFNTTLSWVLLIGVGLYFAARWFIDVAIGGVGSAGPQNRGVGSAGPESRGVGSAGPQNRGVGSAGPQNRWDGARKLALLGIVALAVVVGTNFTTGFRLSGWNKPAGGWLSADQRRDLDALRGTLEPTDDHDRPVVFVIDDEPPEAFQIWGFTKLAGNTSRYGLPPGQIDRGYLYLGSLENYLAGKPTTRGEATYDKLSPALLEDAQRGIERAGSDPIVVVAHAFNQKGSNTAIASGEEPVPLRSGQARPVGETAAEVWVLNEEGVNIDNISQKPLQEDTNPGLAHLLRAVLGFAVLLLPGLLCLRYFMADAGVPERIAVAPALALGLLTVTGIIVVAVIRGPLSLTVALISIGISLLFSGYAFLRSRRKPSPAAT
jgi:hypothetical protein